MPVGIFPNIVLNFKNSASMWTQRGRAREFFPSPFNLFNRKMLGKLWLSLAWERSVRRCLPTGHPHADFPSQGGIPVPYGFMSLVYSSDGNFKMLSPGCSDKQPIMVLWWAILNPQRIRRYRLEFVAPCWTIKGVLEFCPDYVSKQTPLS